MNQVALAPKELVSELEMVTLYMLDEVMHYDPVKNTTHYGGLTILEWLRGYCVLENCYAGESSDPPDGILSIDAVEFEATLQRGGLVGSKAKVLGL